MSKSQNVIRTTAMRTADWGTKIYFTALIHPDGTATYENGQSLHVDAHVLTADERARYLRGE